MKKLILSAALIAVSFTSLAQVGVGNTDPKSSLQVTGIPGNATVVDGIMAPILTGNQLKAKDAVYGALQTGALVYVTAAASPTTTKTVNVEFAGYYYFDGTIWKWLPPGNSSIIKYDLTNDPDIAGLIPVSGSGYYLETPQNAHLVVGIRENEVLDSFSIVSGGGLVGSYYSTDGVFDQIVANFRADGRAGIGKLADPSFGLDVFGTVRANGILLTSDARLKTNIKKLDNALQTISYLNPVSYAKKKTLNVSDTDYDKNEFGFLAQELREVLPELVTEDEDKLLSVDYNSLIPLLTKAVQEQQAQIEALNAELAEIKAVITALKK